MPARSRRSARRSSSSSVGVTSTVRKHVACGAVNALCTIAAAVNLRTPLIGMRRSSAAFAAVVDRAADSRARATTRAAWAGDIRRIRRRRLHVLARDEPVGPGAGERGEVDAELLGEMPHGRRRARALGAASRGGGHRGRGGRRACGRQRDRRLGFRGHQQVGSVVRADPCAAHRVTLAIRAGAVADEVGLGGVGGVVGLGSGAVSRRVPSARSSTRGGSTGGTGAGASPPTSNVTMSAPTSTVSPGSACSACTTPSNGDGSSTTAFAVSTSAMIWLSSTRSPAATRQVTISDSVSPSPRSGSLNSRSMPLPYRGRDRRRPVRARGRRHPGCGPGRAGGASRAWPAGTARRGR